MRGPSILPKQVFEQASQAVLNYNDTGLSILEIGHRTPVFQSIMDEARALVKELMQLDDDHEVLFTWRCNHTIYAGANEFA